MSNLQKSDSVQIRVGVTDNKAHRMLQIREWVRKNGSYIPTKRGITVPRELVDHLIEEMVRHKKTLPRTVAQVDDEQIKFIIAKTRHDAQFHRGRTYDDEAAARKKAPPTGYIIYRATIKSGAVLSLEPIAKRGDSRWLSRKS